MSDFNTVYHGQPADVSEYLDNCAGEFDLSLLRPLLTNAFRQIEMLHNRINDQAKEIELLRERAQ